MNSKEIIVKRLEDGQVQVAKGTWSEVFPEEKRLPWSNWYEQMHKDHGYDGYLRMAEKLRSLGQP